MGFALSMSCAFAQQGMDTRPTKLDAPAGDGDAQATTATQPAKAGSTGTLDLGPSVLKSAIDAADSDYARTDTRSTFGAVTTSQGIGVEQVFKASEIDSCAKAQGALRFAPPLIGPVPLGGLFVAPYWLHATATFRCRI